MKIKIPGEIEQSQSKVNISKPFPKIEIPKPKIEHREIKPIPKIDIKIKKRDTPVSIALPKSPEQAQEAEKENDEWEITNQYGEKILLDEEQRKAVRMAREGRSFVMTGKAGTGKTTTVQAIVQSLVNEHAEKIQQIEYRIKGEGRYETAMSIAVIAFANKPTNNIRDRLKASPELIELIGPNVTTGHNLLEYTVEFYEDPETGKTKRRYFPQKDSINKLEVTHLIVEESGNMATGDYAIWNQIYAALPAGVQVIFLGDINQLPPVGGKSVLSYALQQLPVIELKKVHRTALDNPIIRQALNCLDGKPIVQDYDIEKKQGVRLLDPIRVFKNKNGVKLSAAEYKTGAETIIKNLIKRGDYNPEIDIILCPFNKKASHYVSTKEFNAEVAGYLAQKAEATVWEIRAGFNTVYVRIGDRVMVDKYEGIVTDIKTNAQYSGPIPKAPSKNLDYYGHKRGVEIEDNEFDDFDYSNLDIDKMLENESVSDEEKKRAASAIVDIKLEEGGTITLFQAGHFADTTFTLGYALSVHKAIGSEWPNVILALHDSHHMMLYRELLYTAMTRPRFRLDIIAQPHVIQKAARNPRIKGNTLQDKIEFFNSGYLDQQIDLVPPLVEE